MSRYQKDYQEQADTSPEEVPTQEAPTTSSSDEDSFKKRYGDLRRHMQQQMSERDKEIKQIKAQLNDATKKQIRFPKTEEEVDQWSKKYPDVAQIIDTIAQKRVQEVYSEAKSEIGDLRKQQDDLKTEKAMMQLVKMHPDFGKIRASREFHDWVSEQPKSVQDALYRNKTDAKAASRALDLYKSDKGIRKVRPRKASSAAQSVGRSGVASPSKGRATFSESQVQNMTTAEYDKNEAQIMEAISKGLFEYDVSGAAR
jgi:ribosomal protein L29